MGKHFFVILGIGFLLIWGSGEGYSNDSLITKEQAEKILGEYFSGLKEGHTFQIINLLTGPMRKNNEVLLQKNPEYPYFLKNKYKDAKLVYGNYSSLGAHKAVLEVVIYFNTEEKLFLRFTLVQEAGGLKILKEEEL